MRNLEITIMKSNMSRLFIITISFGLFCLFPSCTYIKNVLKQSGYIKTQRTNPSQHNLKHMIDGQTYFVYGQVLKGNNTYPESPLMLGAYSNRYKSNELVDSTHIVYTDTHYALNLPGGKYELLVLADQDQDGRFGQSEVVGRLQIELNHEQYPDRVAGKIDIRLSEQQPAAWTINSPVPELTLSQQSLVYPKGAIRNLNDPLFDANIAALGMYEPAAFLELGPTLFYALEEDSFKIPVIFVHGMGGSARDFTQIVDRLDRTRYQPWFFYYPSGTDLEQLADIFYNIYLSGTVNYRGEMPIIIIAHSMGGLIAREALNRYSDKSHENHVALLITIASPFAGHPSAALGERNSPLVLPCWRNLNPQSAFIDRLFRKSLPSSVKHQLLYTYNNSKKLAQGKGGDGTVPTSSQLRIEAQRQSTQQVGFNNTHTGVLRDENAIAFIIGSVNQIKSSYPEPHLKILMAGGYDVALDDSYSPKEKYFILTMGKYLSSLANGRIDTFESPVLESFVAVAQGKAKAKSEVEIAWLKFVKDYPQYGQ